MKTKPSAADEERSLALFRDLDWQDQSKLLFRLTRTRYADWFAAKFQRNRDEDEMWRHHAELEEQLMLICPRQHFGELHLLFQGLHFTSLFQTAWGDIAPVILGSDAQDGERADELFQAVHTCCQEGWRGAVKFSRRDALAMIEDWRETVLQQAFSQSSADDSVERRES